MNEAAQAFIPSELLQPLAGDIGMLLHKDLL